ncbi:VanZ like family protein [Chitinophaga sp. CF118]|uniref:VanZ family protein n=1 Tax=Chitinophaga sp. CF118 TaxID=1884367 RepID=UPI0008E10679|nr:VanZ family protein [Chitinophaga sp. CF118]SFE02742.1 VanZ like family protein [Chitinophaga sp. CF118]
MTRRSLKISVTIGYLLLLLCVVILNPLRFEHIVPLGSRLRIHPFVDSLNDISYARGSSWFIHWFNFLGNIFGNIALFIPVSFIAILVFRMQQFWMVVLMACILSLIIETVQYCTGLGVADVDDVILNTAGAAIGFYICKRAYSFLSE